MRTKTFRDRMLSGTKLAGTFMKTPSHEVVEILAMSGLDFVCLDTEHAAIDRRSMDTCLAMARALDFPALVRVGSGSDENILQALDSGAVGVVVPHVTDVDKATQVARAARFGLGGRGFAGSSRWAGFATRPMHDILDQSTNETLVLAQIEEPEAVLAAAEIAAVPGIDGLFVGPADLSVAYGKTDLGSQELAAALASVGAAAGANGKAMVTFVPNIEVARDWAKYGITVFFVGSEHSWMLQGAKSTAAGIHGLD